MTHWTDDANCLGADPDLFFSEYAEAQEQAKAVCRRCPVIDICLEEHLREVWGVFGGTTREERREIRRRRRRSA